MGEMIMHHVLDDYRYEIMHGVIIPLPIILYTDTGLEIFHHQIYLMKIIMH